MCNKNIEEAQGNFGDYEHELSKEQLAEFLKSGEHEFLTAHSCLCFAIIARIYRRVKMGYRFGAIKVCTNEMIVDGNHRYIAYKLAGIEIDVIKGSRSFSDVVKPFNNVRIDVEQDWDANHPYNRKYCDDGFLSKESYY